MFSNILVGLGEDDHSIISGMHELIEMGVIPILRAVVEHPLRVETGMRRPSAERLLRLARKERELLDEYGLRADIAETMCAPCTGCRSNTTPGRVTLSAKHIERDSAAINHVDKRYTIVI